MILKLKPIQCKAVQKWEDLFDRNILQWESIFIQPYKLTIDTKLREFQYKTIMRIIPDNTFLYKCHLVPSNLCDFCFMSIDSITHMFWECPIIQAFWRDVECDLERKLSTNIDLNLENILFCNRQNHEQNSRYKSFIINYIILSAKYFIFKCKCNSDNPNLAKFKHVIKTNEKIEETIALTKNKMYQHNRKWQLVRN